METVIDPSLQHMSFEARQAEEGCHQGCLGIHDAPQQAGKLIVPSTSLVRILFQAALEEMAANFGKGGLLLREIKTPRRNLYLHTQAPKKVEEPNKQPKMDCISY